LPAGREIRAAREKDGPVQSLSARQTWNAFVKEHADGEKCRDPRRGCNLRLRKPDHGAAKKKRSNSA